MIKHPSLLQIFLHIFVILFFSFLLSQTTFAKQGCCSGHGGVIGCDKNSGQQLCKDGTKAANCKCGKTSQQGCCSGHGGILKCDTKSGYQICKDNSKSSCKCK